MDLSNLSIDELNQLTKKITFEKRRRNLESHVSNITKHCISILYNSLKFEFDLHDFNVEQKQKALTSLENVLNKHFLSIKDIETYTQKDFYQRHMNSITKYVFLFQFGGEWSSNITMEWVKSIHNGIEPKAAFKNGGGKEVLDYIIESFNRVFNSYNLQDDFETTIQNIKNHNKRIIIEIENKKLNEINTIFFDLSVF